MIINVPEYFYQSKRFEYLQTEDFTIVDYRSYAPREKIYTYSKDNLLIFVLRGSKVVRFSEGELKVKSGSFIFIPKGNYIMNQISDIEKGNYECLVVCLSDSFLSEFSAQNIDILSGKVMHCNRAQNWYQSNISPYISKEIELMAMYFMDGNESIRKIIKFKLFEILLNILNDKDSCIGLVNCLKEYSSGRLTDIKDFMEKNYDKHLSIEELAISSGRSLSTFKKHFKDTFSDTPQRWINEKRLDKAAYLLNSTGYNVTEVCHIVGFDNLSHFIKLFKNKYEISPNKYRKKFCPQRT